MGEIERQIVRGPALWEFHQSSKNIRRIPCALLYHNSPQLATHEICNPPTCLKFLDRIGETKEKSKSNNVIVSKNKNVSQFSGF